MTYAAAVVVSSRLVPFVPYMDREDRLHRDMVNLKCVQRGRETEENYS